VICEIYGLKGAGIYGWYLGDEFGGLFVRKKEVFLLFENL